MGQAEAERHGAMVTDARLGERDKRTRRCALLQPRVRAKLCGMNPTAPVDAVMFDMDGTLVNSRHAIVSSYHDASTEILGHPHPTDEAELEEILKLRGIDAFPIVVGSDDPQTLLRFSEVFQAAYARHQETIPAYPGLHEALEQLTAMGVKLGIATSKARARLDLDLDRLGLAGYFAYTVTGDEVENGKPAPDPIHAVAEGLGVAIENGLYVGDGENDIKAAHAAGMRAVGVAFGFHPRECRAENPEHFVESYAELVEIVAALRGSRADA
jgi:pyrophosphatase PpaX